MASMINRGEIAYVLKFYISISQTEKINNNKLIVDKLKNYRSIKILFKRLCNYDKKICEDIDKYIEIRMNRLIRDIRINPCKYCFAYKYIDYIENNIVFKKPSGTHKTTTKKEVKPEIKKAKNKTITKKKETKITKTRKPSSRAIFNSEMKQFVINKYLEYVDSSPNNATIIREYLVQDIRVRYNKDVSERNIYEVLRKHFKKLPIDNNYVKDIESYIDKASDRKIFYNHEFDDVREKYCKRCSSGHRSFNKALDTIMQSKNITIVKFNFAIDDNSENIYKDFKEDKEGCKKMYLEVSDIMRNIPYRERVSFNDIVSHITYNVLHYNKDKIESETDDIKQYRLNMYYRLLKKFKNITLY